MNESVTTLLLFMVLTTCWLMQVIVNADVAPLNSLVAAGTSVLLEGELKKTPEGTKQVTGPRGMCPLGARKCTQRSCSIF